MSKAYGMRPAVNPISVDCPTCERKKGLPCATKAIRAHVGIKKGDWIGASQRCHPARVDAAIAAKNAKEAK